ncbi:hypothetical protein CF319_g1987 [Tilletia indica]|nr:hypothetical protein CF319_g1987 [Tilletia indica]
MSVPRQSAAGSSSQAQSLLPSLQSDPVRLNDLFAPHKRTYDGKVAKNKKIPAKTVQKRSKSTTSRTASSSASVGNWPPGFGERSRVVSPPSSPSNEPTQGYDGQLHDVDDQAMNFGWDANDFYSHSALNEDVVSDLDDLATYKESLFESCGLHCERLTAKMWVLEGWKDGQPEVGRFYHISIINLPDSLLVGCECPQARSGSDCIHARLAREAWSLFNSLTPLDSTGSPLVVQIAQLLHGRSFWLSVAAQDLQHASAAPGLHKRCIVSAIKDAEWDCSAPSCARGKLPATACVHRSHASRFVYELHGSDVFQLREEVMADDLAEIQSSPSLILQRQAVSHVKIPPPRFALLPDEAPASAALEPSLLPALLALDSVSRCYACGASDGHEGVTEQREVRVYLVLEVVHRRIEVKRCISHPRVPLPLGVRILWRAIHSSVTSYLSDLGQRPVPPPRLDIPPPAPHHGVLYGAKQIRERPLYPGLKEDKRSGKTVPVGLELTGEGDVCNKYYKDYVIPRRSGGVMALWCRHAISVGFHCMPSAEGRDDVFSALFTRWPKPPSVVVYDFGCQLASYAVAREPDFFGDTLFVVDELHQKGHSSCTPSSWLSTYMANDPKLRHLNSSAAECGNSGLSRIKKSVSYSSATHAIAITRHFLSLWNRRKINVLLSEGSKKGNRK